MADDFYVPSLDDYYSSAYNVGPSDIPSLSTFDYGNYGGGVPYWNLGPDLGVSSAGAVDTGQGITYGVGGEPTGWYSPEGDWQSYADAALANAGEEGLQQYLTGGRDYYYEPSVLDKISGIFDKGGFLDKYGNVLGGLGTGALKIYDILREQENEAANRKLLAKRIATEASRAATEASRAAAQTQGEKEATVLNRANDIDKQKLILARMQEKGMLAPGIDPNQILGRSYSNAQSVFGPGTRYNLNTFATNPYAQVPVFTPLQAAAPTGMACGGMVENLAHGGLASLASGGQADDVPINASQGEYVVDASTVSDLGDGNSRAGGLALDRMVQNVRKHKRANTSSLPPKAKTPETYMRKGRK